MQVKVTHVGDPWKATSQSDPLFTIVVEGNGEPLKTYDKELATVGTHEAEEYLAKSGKAYWRIPKSRTPWSASKQSEKVFKADPAKLNQELTLTTATNQSIQRQVAYKGVIELITSGKIDIDQMYQYFGYSMTLLEAKDWEQVVNPEPPEDLPPVELYDE